MHWYYSSIFALLLFSIQFFLLKVATERKANTELVVASFLSFATLFSFIGYFFLPSQRVDAGLLIWLAFLSGALFFLATLFRLHALKNIPASVAFVIFDFKVLLIVLVSFLFLNEFVNLKQGIGILLGFFAAILVTKRTKEEAHLSNNFKLGLLFGLGAIITMAINGVIVKKAAELYDNPFLYISVSYFITSILAISFYKYRTWYTPLDDIKSKRHAVAIGLLMGFINSLGFFFEFTALQTGPLSLVTPIVALSTAGAIILSVIVYKEKLNLARIVGLIIAFVSLLLLK